MKKIITILIFCLAVFCGSLCAEVLTVATYNVENFCLEDRMIDGVFHQKYPKPESEIAALVQVIKAMNPNVLAMQEMGGPDFLAELQGRLKLVGLDYPYSTIMPGGDPERHEALLSREKFQAFHFQNLLFKYEGEERPVLRGLLEARFTTPEGKRWDLFVVHLRSKISKNGNDPESDDYRVGEAGAVREQILKLEPEGSPYLLVGDFNDGPKSSALKRFLTKGDAQLLEMTHPLDEHGEEWTERWEGHGELSEIDYILGSPPMMMSVVPDSVHIYDGPGVMNASDHRPIFVKIDTLKIGGKR